VQDPARRAAMGVAARASVEHRSWPVVCDELLAHYDSVLGIDTLGKVRAA